MVRGNGKSSKWTVERLVIYAMVTRTGLTVIIIDVDMGLRECSMWNSFVT